MFYAILLQPELYDVLLCLADLCPDYMVRQNAMKLLDVIPTDGQIVQQLRAVLSSGNACESMRQLLIGSGVVKPARLLYTLQVIGASLYGGLLQRHVLDSGGQPQMSCSMHGAHEMCRFCRRQL